MIRSVVFLDQREKIETALCSHSFKSTGTYNISTGVLVLEIYTIMKVKYYPDFSLSVTEYSQSMSHKLNLKEDVKLCCISLGYLSILWLLMSSQSGSNIRAKGSEIYNILGGRALSSSHSDKS